MKRGLISIDDTLMLMGLTRADFARRTGISVAVISLAASAQACLDTGSEPRPGSDGALALVIPRLSETLAAHFGLVVEARRDMMVRMKPYRVLDLKRRPLR